MEAAFNAAADHRGTPDRLGVHALKKEFPSEHESPQKRVGPTKEKASLLGRGALMAAES
jgi:hypothetical protein